MAGTAVLDRPIGPRRARTLNTVALALAIVIGLVFIGASAVPYLTLNEQRFGMYWPRRWQLLLHIVPGMVALLTGPVQLWLGARRQWVPLHRALGFTYIGAIAVSVVGAAYLVTHSDGPWVFRVGLGGLAVSWVLTTGLAFVAIRRRAIAQHREWMIRSCVVTFAFVTFRAILAALQAGGVGATPEQLGLAAWACWAVPLVITEVVLQARKVFV